MEILQLDGLEPQLFNLIGPLAMNPKVLRANNNYPFKTTERFQWYIAVEDNDVTKHEAIFSNCGFQTEHRWTNYIKMIYNTNKNE